MDVEGAPILVYDVVGMTTYTTERSPDLANTVEW
jgi:hypothetical protein